MHKLTSRGDGLRGASFLLAPNPHLIPIPYDSAVSWRVELNLPQQVLIQRAALVGHLVEFQAGPRALRVAMPQDDRNARGHVYNRVMNELPGFGLIAIVLLAVLKPGV